MFDLSDKPTLEDTALSEGVLRGISRSRLTGHFDISFRAHNGIASQRLKHKTNDVGIVVGYGNRQVGNKYLSTIKVQLTNFFKIGEIKEDFYST